MGTFDLRRWAAMQLLKLALKLDVKSVFTVTMSGAILSGFSVTKDGKEYAVYRGGKQLTAPTTS